MKNFFKYMNIADEDRNWGLYLTVAGSSLVPPYSSYPLTNHPGSYYFKWDEGRILKEYQINYITEGEGIMETKHGNFKVAKGSVILLFPGMWHRYRPNNNSGWSEHYIGFNGAFTEQIYRNELLTEKTPVLKLGFQESVLKEFDDIFNLVQQEKAGFQLECSGKLIYILGRIISIIKNSEFAGKEIERKIRQSCLFFRDNIDKKINMEQHAMELHLSYSYFRRMFKKYTGFPPTNTT